ncbi:MAG TPA: hypothetical protein PK959_18030 [Candidatus Competibacteraceae bacterium]|nr:hypothetical protein [Candidatus Competibacteraceae bacterium]
MTEERAPYPAGHAATPEPSLTTEALIAKAHAHQQGIPTRPASRGSPGCRNGCAPWPT